MRRIRILIAGLALAPAAVVPVVWGQQPAKPENYNPVPPQFRGQPTNPTNFNGQAVIPSGTFASPGFRAIGPTPAVAAPPPATPADPKPADTPKAPELLPPSPLGAPVLAPPVPAFAPAPALPAPTKPVAPNAVPPTVPSVVIEKRCPETVNAGAKLTYEIIVRNLGQSAVQNTRVEEDLPAGTKFIGSDPPAEAGGDRLAWSLGQLEPGVERKLRVEVQPAADGEFKSIAVVTMSTMATMRTSVVRPKLAITLSGPEQVQAGDVIPLSIQVQNPGTGTASSVMLRVKLPAGLTHPGGSHIEAELGILPAGEVRTIPLRVTATAGGPQTAEVSATGEGGLEAAASVRAMVLQPQLLVKRNGPAKVTYKSEVTEEYELANPGNAPAANVTMTEVLPAGLEFVGASDGAVYDPVGRSVTWRLGSQAPGAVRRVVLKAKATAVGDQPTRVVANADRGLEAKTDGSVNVEGIPALRLEVVDLEDPVEVGGELVYEIRIVNQGSCACTNIRIVCDVPEGMQAIEAMGPGNFQLSGAQLAFDPLPKLAPKADVVYRVKARGQAPGDYRFKAQMTCDQLRTPVNKEESSRVYKNGE